MSKLKLKTDICKGCGLCVEFCPKKVLRLSAEINQKGYHYVEAAEPKNCIGCCGCAVMCPDSVIEVE